MSLSDASQLLLVDERDLVDVVDLEDLEVLCRCGHPRHGGACEVVVEVLRGRCGYGLAYVGTGPCPCSSEAAGGPEGDDA